MSVPVGPHIWPEGLHPDLNDAERRELQDQVKAAQPYDDEFWVFGFGSLMWNPGMEVKESRGATLQGYERKFHIWSTVGRGTHERPGLGLCLEPTDGSCRGIAYSLDMATLQADLDYLWSREMGSGVYRPKWVPVTLDGEPEAEKMALTFVINPGHVQHAGPLPVEQMVAIMGGAEGKYGRCRDYLAHTVAEMAKLGERDPLLEEVLGRIDTAEA